MVVSSGESFQDLVMAYDKLASDLEKQELEAPVGIATAQVYSQLMAIYLLQNDLPNAKLLWKRISLSVKQANPELAKVWSVGQKLWNRDFPGIYTALKNDWPEHLKPIMNLIGEATRRRTLNLVAKAYTSIHVTNVAAVLDQTPEKTVESLTALDWTVDSNSKVVTPLKPVESPEKLTPSEEQLAKLTDFVAFLET